MSLARGLVAIAIAGCHVSDVDLTGKACPCAVGWTCDQGTNTCVRDLAPDAADATTLDQGLQFWFKLDESDGTVAADSSGHGANGTLDLAHATWFPTAGKLGGALHLDGTPYTGCVQFPTPCPSPTPSITASLTVSAWVDFDKLQSAPYALGDHAVVQGTSGGSEGAWGIGATNKCGGETIGFSLTPDSNSSARAIRCGTTPIATGTWYHVTGVFDGATTAQELYVNGVKEDGMLVGTTPSTLFHPPACPKLACPSNQMNVMAGFLDEVRIYDRVLSAGEVAALYRASGG